jgi:hypothetical protein
MGSKLNGCPFNSFNSFNSLTRLLADHYETLVPFINALENYSIYFISGVADDLTGYGLVHNSDQLTSGCVGLFRKTLFLYLKYCDIRG